MHQGPTVSYVIRLPVSVYLTFDCSLLLQSRNADFIFIMRDSVLSLFRQLLQQALRKGQFSWVKAYCIIENLLYFQTQHKFTSHLWTLFGRTFYLSEVTVGGEVLQDITDAHLNSVKYMETLTIFQTAVQFINVSRPLSVHQILC